jgi:hypothetical protein
MAMRITNGDDEAIYKIEVAANKVRDFFGISFSGYKLVWLIVFMCDVCLVTLAKLLHER